jgi:hypothetical protein
MFTIKIHHGCQRTLCLCGNYYLLLTLILKKGMNKLIKVNKISNLISDWFISFDDSYV